LHRLHLHRLHLLLFHLLPLVDLVADLVRVGLVLAEAQAQTKAREMLVFWLE
jgi:hypothetical protein